MSYAQIVGSDYGITLLKSCCYDCEVTASDIVVGKIQIIYRLLSLLLSAIALFLSVWIVIPAPIFALLPLGVGAPEVSPWLLGANALGILLSLSGATTSGLSRIVLGCSVAGLLLSILPLSQFPAANHQAAIAFEQTFGKNYLTTIPKVVQEQMRPHPFVLADAFRGIATSPVRYTPDILFASPDGLPLTLDVYRPPQVGSYPAIMMIHGGAWQTGGPTDNAAFSRYMAARGYVVWAIAYRHAPRYHFPAQIEDVRAALTFIHQHAAEYEADLKHIALMGRSAGAHLAMLAAYQPSALSIQAVVNYYGPIDLTAGYNDPPHPDPIHSRAVLKAFLGGSPKELGDLYRAASPISYVTKSLPPTLLIYGGRDHVVQAKFGRGLSDRLRAVNTTAVFIEIPWAEHAFDAIFSGVSNQLALYYTERFLAWTLKK